MGFPGTPAPAVNAVASLLMSALRGDAGDAGEDCARTDCAIVWLAVAAPVEDDAVAC